MDPDERLTALKKAYADIILNTAKEAAGRIMVSERKAVRTQHELNAMKDQALQMLLRLKQTMDSKVCEAGMTYLSQQKKIDELELQLWKANNTVSEAEAVSLSQQRKIEELEAQLHEAEDIVKDLREELREMQAELERVRNSKVQNMDNHDTASQKQALYGNRLNAPKPIVFRPNSRLEPFASDMKTSALNQRNEVHRYYNVNSPVLEEHRLNTSQSVMFPTSKAQIESFIESDMKNSSLSRRNDVSNSYNPNQLRIGASCVSKPDIPSIIMSGKEPQPFRNRRTQRIRAFEEKLMAGELTFSEPLDDVNYETSGREDGEGEEGFHKMPGQKAAKVRGRKKKDSVQADDSGDQVQKVKKVRRRRRRAASYKKNKAVLSKNQTSQISHIEKCSLNSNAQANGDHSEMASKLSEDKADEGTTLGFTEVTESEVEFHEDPDVENPMNKDKAPMDKILSVGQESGIADNLGVSICKMDVEKAEDPSICTEGKPSLTGRVIKYTFQRKRKREALDGSAGNASIENNVLKEMEMGKRNDLLETEKSGSITESSRDSRRVAQVARQLISLSGKKWWQ
ncbi:hypothetical protein NMG60_11009555 [Bertholletia excelsa]